MKHYTTIFVLNREHTQLLLLKRDLFKKTHPGTITGFGGSVEDGETYEACARRELEEELNIAEVGQLYPIGTREADNRDGYGDRQLHDYVTEIDVFPTSCQEGVPVVIEATQSGLRAICDEVIPSTYLVLNRLIVELEKCNDLSEIPQVDSSPETHTEAEKLIKQLKIK